MAYRIHMFDGLVITDITHLPENGSNDMGSGNALTSFSQLPGGGFFDNYGAGDSPQGIRPITRNCVLWGDTQAELITNIKAIRGKIGRRGRLTIQFDDGELWWQWARLQDVRMPRPQDAKGNFLPCNLSWVTASQQWYGIVQSGDTWSVGDDSFYLGDGSVSLGMNDHLYELAAGTDSITPTLTNNGNTLVRNMKIVLTTDENMLGFQLYSANAGQRLNWVNSTHTGAFSVIIDTGAKSCLVRMDDVTSAIESITPQGAEALITTIASHFLEDGDSVEISSTTDFDGIYHNIRFVDSDHFIVDLPGEPDQRGIESSGNVKPIYDGWPDLTVYDRKNWFVLFPGDNAVNVAHVGGAIPYQDYTVQFSWYDHYK